MEDSRPGVIVNSLACQTLTYESLASEISVIGCAYEVKILPKQPIVCTLAVAHSGLEPMMLNSRWASGPDNWITQMDFSLE